MAALEQNGDLRNEPVLLDVEPPEDKNVMINFPDAVECRLFETGEIRESQFDNIKIEVIKEETTVTVDDVEQQLEQTVIEKLDEVEDDLELELKHTVIEKLDEVPGDEEEEFEQVEYIQDDFESTEYIKDETGVEENVLDKIIRLPPAKPKSNGCVVLQEKRRSRPSATKGEKGVLRAKTKLQKMTPEERELYQRDNERINRFFTFKCDECNTEFDTYQVFLMHMRGLHDVKIPLVFCCNRKLKSRCHLLDHLNFHVQPESLQCHICFKISRDTNQLKNHIKGHTDGEHKKYECEHCNRRFLFKSTLKYHMYKHLTYEEKEASKKYQCEECGSSFPSVSFLRYHINWKHIGKYQTKCELCGKVCVSRHRYKLHYYEQHADINTVESQCPECKETFRNKYTMRKHFDRMHKSRGTHTCNICDRECPNLLALEDHIKNVHVRTIGKHRCEECGKAFKNAINLREHMSMHHGAGPLYKCDFCDRTFNSNANMYSHRKRQHPVLLEQLKQAKKAAGKRYAYMQ